MANPYATERWLRARLKEHGDALRTARETLEWIANSAGEKLERGFMGERHADCVFRAREALTELEAASARSNRV